MVKIIAGVNDLFTTNPGLAKEWHPSKNGNLTPQMITSGSCKKVWWLGKCGHEWQQTPLNRKNGTGCPFCAGKRVLIGFNDLSTVNPELAKEWSFEKNEALSPSDFTVNSGKSVWWVCENGHEWKASIYQRNNGTNCPFCSGRYAIEGKTDLLSVNPSLAREWNYKKNDNIMPTRITAKSSKKVWWICGEGHEWQETPSNRSTGRGCPYCSGRRILIGFNDLKTINPVIASEWDYEKNGDLKPTMVSAKTSQKVWWICKEGHEWQATVYTRNRGSGCPYCYGRYPIKGQTDLLSVNPLLASEWDYEKNGELSPEYITPHSEKKVWWKCPICSNSWKAAPATRSAFASNCPKCGRRNKTSFPEQAIYFYIKKVCPDAINSYKDVFENGMELDIYIPSLKVGIEYDGPRHFNQKRDAEKYKICRDNDIKLVRVSEISRPSPEKLCDIFIQTDYRKSSKSLLNDAIIELFNVLKLKYIVVSVQDDRNEIYSQYLTRLKDNSLARVFPQIAAEWNYSKNNELTPEMFNWGVADKVWWKCSTCNNEWCASIASRSSGTGCPACAKEKRLKSRTETFFRNGRESAASAVENLRDEWCSEKNIGIELDKLTLKSNKKVWWRCALGHEWQANIANRTSGQGCPYCSNHKVLKGFNDLQTLYPEIAKTWDYVKNCEKSPDMYTAKSNVKIWWKCSLGHEWQVTIAQRTSSMGCPFCNGRKIWTGYNDLETLRPDLMEEWDYEKNGSVMPSKLSEHSSKKVWWKCKIGHEWQATVDSRASGHGCPKCGHKITAEKLSERYKNQLIGKNKNRKSE